MTSRAGHISPRAPQSVESAWGCMGNPKKEECPIGKEIKVYIKTFTNKPPLLPMRESKSYQMAGGCLCVRFKPGQTRTLGYEVINLSSKCNGVCVARSP